MTGSARAAAVDFDQLVEAHRKDLHAHCYRMLGSLHDADDALQDTLIRAWRALPKFRGDSSPRTWLYRIATNVCLDAIARRPKRVLPIDYGPLTPPGLEQTERPLIQVPWIEPYPDKVLGVADGCSAGRPLNGRSEPCRQGSGYRELGGTQLSGSLTRRTTSSTIMNPRFR